MLGRLNSLKPLKLASQNATSANQAHLILSEDKISNYVKNEQQISDFKNNKFLIDYKENQRHFLFLEKSKDVQKLANAVQKKLNEFKVYDCDLFAEDLNIDNLSLFLRHFQGYNYKFDNQGVYGDKEQQEKCKDSQFKSFESFNVCSPKIDVNDKKIQQSLIVGNNQRVARELGNLRPNQSLTEEYVDFAKQLVKENENLELTYIMGDDLARHNLNLIHAVGKGAENPPAMISLHYKGNKDSDETHALIGKGVIFDAGGLNIKMTGNIEGMFLDKHGSSSVLGAFKSVVEAKLKVNLVCTVAMVENLVGHKAYHPMDIIKSHKGLTVEIGNTDAEGRLILCDCMSWTQEKHKLKSMIELSTLTGAMVVALSSTYAGCFCNDDELAKKLISTGEICQEKLWRMPLHQDYVDTMKGKNSDLVNYGGPYGGACTAAAYLQQFVDEGVQWAHLDVAGTTGIIPSKQATGYGVQLLFDHFNN